MNTDPETFGEVFVLQCSRMANLKLIKVLLFICLALALPCYVLSPIYRSSKEEQTTQLREHENKDRVRHGSFNISKNEPLKGGNYWMDGKLCAGIEKVVGFSSMVDFGAGLGQYGRCLTRSFKELLNTDKKFYTIFKQELVFRMAEAKLLSTKKVIKSWEGFDGASDVDVITKNFVKRIDLSKIFDLGKKYDWVMSLEVGEHLPHEYEDIFLDNLIRHARKGIILSWAVLGQSGHNHVNNHDNEYIIQKMKERGWKNDVESQNFLRSNVLRAYFINTVMVFRNKN